MDLLGENLEELRIRHHNFTLTTVLNIAIQIIDRIEVLHSLNIIHRDIKPENFVVGLTDKNILYLIDFGLAKYYHFNGKHIPFRENRGLIGTARYSSVNALQGKEQSRRDDLEAVGYMLIMLHSGRLPWMNIASDDKLVKYGKILKMKECISIDTLTFNLPKTFGEYIRYVRQLQFEETPNYQYLRSLFETSIHQYDWINEKCYFKELSLPMIKRNYEAKLFSHQTSPREINKTISKIQQTSSSPKQTISEEENPHFIAREMFLKKPINTCKNSEDDIPPDELEANNLRYAYYNEMNLKIKK